MFNLCLTRCPRGTVVENGHKLLRKMKYSLKIKFSNNYD